MRIDVRDVDSQTLLDGRTVAGKNAAVLSILKESGTGNVLLCACDAEDGLSNGFEKDGTT